MARAAAEAASGWRRIAFVHRAGVALAVLWTVQAPVHAQKRPEAIALTASGGVSLGAYQAGYLYFATETVRRTPTAPPLRLVTGASAGSINAFLTAVSSCR